MDMSPDSAIEKQKNQHTHNRERTAPQVRSFLFGSFNYAPRANHRLRHTSKKTSPASLSNGKSLETKRFKPSLHLSFVSISVLLYQQRIREAAVIQSAQYQNRQNSLYHAAD